MSRKKYQLSEYYMKGVSYSVPLDEVARKKWEDKNDGTEEEVRLMYIQVDEYDENGIWVNREREMVNEWYKETKEMEIIKRFKDSHPSTEWEYIN